MGTTNQHVVQAPRSGAGSLDAASIAIIALIVAIVAGLAGWAVARQSSTSAADVQRASSISAQQQYQRGVRTGNRDGATQGRREAAAERTSQLAGVRRTAESSGYAAGIEAGRNAAAVSAGDQDADMLGLATMSSDGAYPAESFEDILAGTSLADDVPGYADSALSSRLGSSDPLGSYGGYPGAYSATSGVSYGDDSSLFGL